MKSLPSLLARSALILVVTFGIMWIGIAAVESGHLTGELGAVLSTLAYAAGGAAGVVLTVRLFRD